MLAMATAQPTKPRPFSPSCPRFLSENHRLRSISTKSKSKKTGDEWMMMASSSGVEEEARRSGVVEKKEEGKKKKKKRWRDQEGVTVVISQLAYECEAWALEAHLKKVCSEVEVSAVRLVQDAATRAGSTDRKHAGMAYVVCEARPEVLASKADGTEVLGRKIRAEVLSPEKKKKEGVGRAGVEALMQRADFTADERLIRTLAKESHYVASRVVADASKKKTKNPAAYALGVLRRLKAEGVEAHTEPLATKKQPKQLTLSTIDELVDDAARKAGFDRSQVDARARDYLREFTKPQAQDALDQLVRSYPATTHQNKKQRLDVARGDIASPSAFLMGILRDKSSRKKHLAKPKSSPPAKKPPSGTPRHRPAPNRHPQTSTHHLHDAAAAANKKRRRTAPAASSS